MSETAWKEKFPEVFLNLQKNRLARQLSANQWLFLAIEQELLSEGEYLSWASDYYGLARLQSEYFSQVFSNDLLEKYKSLYTWGPHCLPVAEWEDTLFVACLEPEWVPEELVAGGGNLWNPEGPTPPRVIRPLLAKAKDLIQVWNKVTSNQEFSASSSEESPAVPFYEEALTPEAPLTEAPVMKSDGQEVSMEDLFSQVPIRTNLFPNAPMDLSPPPQEFSLGNEKASAEEESQDLEIFISPNLPLPTLSALPQEPVAPAVSKVSEPISFQAAPLIPPSAPLPIVPPPLPMEARPIEPRNDSPPLSAPPSAPSLTISKEEALLGARPTNNPPPAPHGRLLSSDPALKTLDPALMDALNGCFTRTYDYYRNLMIFKLKDNVITPFHWDKTYRSQAKVVDIELNEPSVFRIVAKTRKPFHGKVSGNPINDRFFDDWFDGKVPTNITMVPLYWEGRIVGCLFGNGQSGISHDIGIPILEKTAEMIVTLAGSKLVSA